MREPVEGWTRGEGGCRLRTLRWPVASPRGRVQVVHGLSEHLGRYAPLAMALNGAGYSVFGHDHRGHGRSGGPRGVVGSFGDLVEDLHRVRGLADELAPGPGSPVLLAHSMGGLVAIRYLQGAGPDPRPFPPAVVISAPWLGTSVPVPWHVRLALPILRRVAADLPIPRPTRPEMLTADPEQAAAFARDPLVVRALAVSFFDQVVREQGSALAAGMPPGVEALVMAPEDDMLCDPRTTMAWAAGAGPGVEAWSLPDTRHEPFTDTHRNKIFQRLVEWLDRIQDRTAEEME